VSTPDERSTKTCPDCAEEVLEAARKCRFCGYRFDAEEPASPAPTALPDEDTGLLGGLLVRRKPRNVTAPQIIAAAGGHLAPDEIVAFFRFAHVNELDAIVVVTSTRLFFLEGVGKRHRLRFEHDLTHVLDTKLTRRLGRHRLEVRCAGGEDLLIGGLKRNDLLELQLLLRPPIS
jgi:hypothetical protein